MDVSKLHAGMVIKDYKQLCSLIGEKVKSSNSKVSQLKELQRWVKIEKLPKSISYIIQEIYPIVKPKDDSRDIYKQHIQFILLDYIARNGDTELTKSQIMLMCGMCNPRYFELEQEDYILNQDQVTEFDLKDFYRRTSLKLSEIIDSAVKGLGGSNYCYCVVRKCIKIYTPSGDYIASAEEEDIIIDLKRKVLNSMGLTGVQQAFRKFKQKEFFNEVNKRLNALYGWYRCQQIYQLTTTPRIQQNLQHFTKLLEDKGQNKKELNDKVMKYFNTDAVIKYDTNQQERKELEQKLTTTLSDSVEHQEYLQKLQQHFNFKTTYVQAQLLIAQLLLELYFDA